MDTRSTAAIQALMNNYGVSQQTAEIIYDQRSVPAIADLPPNTPDEDMISLIMNTQGVSEDEAQISMLIQRGRFPTSVIIEDVVELDSFED